MELLLYPLLRLWGNRGYVLREIGDEETMDGWENPGTVGVICNAHDALADNFNASNRMWSPSIYVLSQCYGHPLAVDFCDGQT